MATEQLTIHVDPQAAKVYREASDQERLKLDILLSLRLLSANDSDRSLEQVMADMSRKAQQRGLTPEMMQSILDER